MEKEIQKTDGQPEKKNGSARRRYPMRPKKPASQADPAPVGSASPETRPPLGIGGSERLLVPMLDMTKNKNNRRGRPQKRQPEAETAAPERQTERKPENTALRQTSRQAERTVERPAERPAETSAKGNTGAPRTRRKGAGRAEQRNDDRPIVAEPVIEQPKPAAKTHVRREKTQEREGAKLRIIPLGGLNEIGKNITVVEYGDDIVVVDCGMGFPDEEMPGIDLVIPDITYLEENKDRIRGIFLTHGHEDHIGAIPYVLRTINPPIYGTRLTLGIIRNKLEEHTLAWTPKLIEVKAGDVVRAGCMSVEFIRVNHSIADACCLAIRTPVGLVIHTGDFKLDTSPIEGEMMNLTRLGELGNEGVLLLMCESTNAERPGFTPSERKVGESLEYIFSQNPDKRLVIATFSSNVHRVQQIIDISVRHGRKIAVTGRSMVNIVGAAVELGYMNVPAGALIDLNDIKRYRPEELTIVTTGSQGEAMSALYRMAYSDHSQITLGQKDLVVLSASAIPGNEKQVGRIINELSRNNINVMHEAAVAVHVSGHACQEELKLMQALTKPKYFMPVHGEYRHLAANRDLALYLGMDSNNIFISDIGKVLEIDRKGARFTQEVIPSGRVLVDGYGVGDVGNIVLRDRLHLAQDGLIVVVATLDEVTRELISGPDIVSRGFVYVRESESLMDEARKIACDTIMQSLRSSRDDFDRMALKKNLKEELTKFLYAKTKRKPMILPVIMDV